MNDSLYRETILEHWRNPQNFGEIKNADFVIDEDNPLCGDQIRLTGKIQNNKITDIKFSGDGCVISRASASILTEYSKGKSISRLKNLTQQIFLSLLNIPLTAARLKCALLIFSALQKGMSSVLSSEFVIPSGRESSGLSSEESSTSRGKIATLTMFARNDITGKY